MQVSISLFLNIILVLAGFLFGAGIALIFCKWLPSPTQKDEKRRQKKEKAQKTTQKKEESPPTQTKTLSEKIQDKPSYVNDITNGNYSERTKQKRKDQTKAYQYLKGRKGGEAK